MSSFIIPEEIQKFLDGIVVRRKHWERQKDYAEKELDAIDLESQRMAQAIAAYNSPIEELRSLMREIHTLVAELREKAGRDTPTNAGVAKPLYSFPEEAVTATTTQGEPTSLIDRIREEVLLRPGRNKDIAKRLGIKNNSVGTYLTKLARKGEIVHYPKYSVWGPAGWTPPTDKGVSSNV